MLLKADRRFENFFTYQYDMINKENKRWYCEIKYKGNSNFMNVWENLQNKVFKQFSIMHMHIWKYIFKLISLHGQLQICTYSYSCNMLPKTIQFSSLLSDLSAKWYVLNLLFAFIRILTESKPLRFRQVKFNFHTAFHIFFYIWISMYAYANTYTTPHTYTYTYTYTYVHALRKFWVFATIELLL